MGIPDQRMLGLENALGSAIPVVKGRAQLGAGRRGASSEIPALVWAAGPFHVTYVLCHHRKFS